MARPPFQPLTTEYTMHNLTLGTAPAVTLPPVPCPRGCGAPATPGHQCGGAR